MLVTSPFDSEGSSIQKQSLKKQPTQHVDGYVFLTKRGQPYNKHVDREWRTAERKAGVRHRRGCQLRHTFASLCLALGSQPTWIAEMLGHKTSQITFDHYARFINDSREINEQRIEDYISKLKAPNYSTGTQSRVIVICFCPIKQNHDCRTPMHSPKSKVRHRIWTAFVSAYRRHYLNTRSWIHPWRIRIGASVVAGHIRTCQLLWLRKLPALLRRKRLQRFFHDWHSAQILLPISVASRIATEEISPWNNAGGPHCSAREAE